MRIDEINTRLAAIQNEIDDAEGEGLTALEQEVEQLTAERQQIQNEVQTRQQLRNNIAAGLVTGNIIENHQEDNNMENNIENREQQELRSFADFIRGTATQMRAGEQNFSISNNGALLPTSIANRIIETVRDMCPILAGADVYHVSGTLKIPVYGKANTTHDIAVGYGADFTELTADAGAFTSVDLTGYLVGALSLVGRSLLNNADIDLVSFVVRKMAESISVFVEGELLTGTGATNSHCTGALSTTNTMNAGSVSAISADNLIDLQVKVNQAFQKNAVWTMHPSTWTVIKKLKDKNDRYLVQDDITGEFPYRLLGKPVYLSDNMPTIASAAKAVLYGDYSGLSVNIRENMTVEVLREKYATQHAVGVVAWMELDSKVSDPQKLATLVMSTGAAS